MSINLLEKQATLDDVVREVSRFKETVTDAVDEGVKSAIRTIKQGRNAAEDAIHDTRHAVKQSPLPGNGYRFCRWSHDRGDRSLAWCASKLSSRLQSRCIATSNRLGRNRNGTGASLVPFS